MEGEKADTKKDMSYYKDLSIFILVIVLTVSLSMLFLNEFTQYKAQLNKDINPCNTCKELNPTQALCINACFNVGGYEGSGLNLDYEDFNSGSNN